MHPCIMSDQSCGRCAMDPSRHLGWVCPGVWEGEPFCETNTLCMTGHWYTLLHIHVSWSAHRCFEASDLPTFFFGVMHAGGAANSLMHEHASFFTNAFSCSIWLAWYKHFWWGRKWLFSSRLLCLQPLGLIEMSSKPLALSIACAWSAVRTWGGATCTHKAHAWHMHAVHASMCVLTVFPWLRWHQQKQVGRRTCYQKAWDTS